MARNKPMPPIASFGPAVAAPVQKIDDGIGKAAACLVKYQAMIAADLDQVLSQVKAGVIVSKTIIDAWTVQELDKVKRTYAGCAACIDDWLARMSWEALQLASQLVPPASILPGPVPIPGAQCPPGTHNDPVTGQCVMDVPGGGGGVPGIPGGTAPGCATPIGSTTGETGCAAVKPYGCWTWELTNTVAGHVPNTLGLQSMGNDATTGCWFAPWPLAGPFATLAQAQAEKANWPFPSKRNMQITVNAPIVAPGFYLVGQFRSCGPCKIDGGPGDGGPGDGNGNGDDPAACCLPGQRVTVHSDNTWSIEGDLVDFPVIAALLAGVTKIIARDDPLEELDEWELDEGPPLATPDLALVDYQPVGSWKK